MAYPKITIEAQQELADYFNVDIEDYKQKINCPFHNDETPSASIDFKHNKFSCWVCKLPGDNYFIISLAECYKKLFLREPQFESDFRDDNSNFNTANTHSKRTRYQQERIATFKKQITTEYFTDCLNTFIAKRCITQETYANCVEIAELEKDKDDEHFGYITFKHDTLEGVTYSRCFIPALENLGASRHLNSEGQKGLFGLSSLDINLDVILVEGFYDLLTLKQLGFNNVVSSFGSQLKPGDIYSLRHIKGSIFVLYDNDYAGFSGANEVLQTAKGLGMTAIKLELPSDFGKDPNKILQDGKAELLATWLREQLDQFASNDIPFVSRAFYEEAAKMAIYPSGLTNLDALLGGGYKPGCHIITGMPGVSKTNLAVFLAINFILKSNVKVLYCSYEISKLQIWSRVASFFSQMIWSDIEVNPLAVEDNIKEDLKVFAERLRVVTDFDISSIDKASNNFDVCIVDYLQIMPSPIINLNNPTRDNAKDNLSFNITTLAKIGMHRNKVVLAISSLPKEAYKKDQMSSKDSGTVDYAVQSYTKVEKYDDSNIVELKMFKNTRGIPGHITTIADFGHARYTPYTKDEKME